MKFQVNQAKYANETSVAPVNKRKSVCLEDESIEDPLFAAQVSKVGLTRLLQNLINTVGLTKLL